MNTMAEYRKIDFSKLTNRITETISTADSLQEVLPIDWTNEVLCGNKEVIITKEGDGK